MQFKIGANDNQKNIMIKALSLYGDIAMNEINVINAKLNNLGIRGGKIYKML